MTIHRTPSWRRFALPGARSCSLLAVIAVLLCSPLIGRAQEAADSTQGSVQIIHATPAVGPVDVYIDGSIVLVGLAFTAASDPILLAAGEHNLEMVESGRSRDDPLVRASISVTAGSGADLALIGPADDLRLEAYPVDLTPLPPDLARLGAVLGAMDTGPVDLAVTAGDLLFPTIEVAGATEFADVAAGAYDLEVRYGGTESVVLALPGTILEAGVVYRLYVVGESAIGELQPLLIGRPAENLALVGFPAWVQAGGCVELGAADTVADLNLVAVSPFAEPSGHADAAVAESSFSTIGVPYATLVDEPHAVVVGQPDDASGEALACGEIGGVQTVDGSLVVGLRAMPGSTTSGIAVVSPNILDFGLTDISIFIADGLVSDASGAPVAAEADPTPPPLAAVLVAEPEPNPSEATPALGP